MKKITAPTNPFVKQIVALHSTKGRREYGHFIAEGLRTIETLVAGGMKPIHFLATEQAIDTAQQFASQYRGECIEVTEPVMNKISPSATPSGLLAIFAIPQQKTDPIFSPGVVLDHISDPGNMGTLIRSAVAFGCQSIIIIGGADCWSPKVIQSSSGAIAHAAIIESSWKTLFAQDKRPPLCALVVKGGKRPTDIPLRDYLLVIGNEAHGIDPKNAYQCHEQVTLQMPGNTESLNAAIAGSIALYLGMLHQS